MSKMHIRRLLASAACLLLGANEILADGEMASARSEDWEPISFAISIGSMGVAGSVVGQGAAKEPGLDPAKTCNPDLDVRENHNACSNSSYFPMGRRCKECRRIGSTQESALAETEPEFALVVVRDARNPNALEVEFGNVKFDDTPTPGSQDDAPYIVFNFRRNIFHNGKEDRLRIFAGIGAGIYDVEPDREPGLNLRIGGTYELTPERRRKNKPFLALELKLIHHRLRPGLDTTDAQIGIRWFWPKSQ